MKMLENKDLMIGKFKVLNKANRQAYNKTVKKVPIVLRNQIKNEIWDQLRSDIWDQVWFYNYENIRK